MPGLLVSVRSPEEALAALAGGAAVIDVKDPAEGPLGRAAPSVQRAVVTVVRGQCRLTGVPPVPVSVALGELVEWVGRRPEEHPLPAGVSYVKVGLSACDRREWKPMLAGLRDAMTARAEDALHPPAWIAVAYADQAWSRSPAPLEVLRFAEEAGFAGVLLDTWEKNDNTLADWITRSELERFVAQAKWADLRVTLAGSLRAGAIRELAPLGPDWFGVRGAACRGGFRDSSIDEGLVADLVAAARDH